MQLQYTLIQLSEKIDIIINYGPKAMTKDIITSFLTLAQKPIMYSTRSMSKVDDYIIKICTN